MNTERRKTETMSQERPNILIIYPDQMRADAMSCAGNPCIQTPNLDRLAAEGVRFENAFISFPLCCPFRASLMTGKYAHSNGMYANHYPIPLDQDFLAETLKQNGYQTGYVGKWHLNGGPKSSFVRPEERLGFESFIGFSRAHQYFGSIFYRNDDPRPRTSARYEPDYQTDHLIELMEGWASDPQGRPFFGMICYGLPHPPLIAPESYLNLYSPEQVPVSPNTPKDKERAAREFLAKYYGLVANVDDNLGRVLDWLDANGLADNTLVLLVSDHGDLAGEHGRFGKKRCYRNSMQAPLIVRCPSRFAAGQKVSHLVDPSVDTMPMILDLLNIPVPDAVQGTSYVPLLTGSSEPTRGAIHYEILMEKEGPECFPIPERGIRTQEWLYVRTADAPMGLFDLRNDPLEMQNLVGQPSHASIQAQLDQRVREHIERTNDRWDIEAVFPPPDFQTHEEGKAFAELLVHDAILEA